jgi:hypothetical protein
MGTKNHSLLSNLKSIKMKRLKFFAVFSIIALFTLGNANAQPKKTTTTVTIEECLENYPCVGEKICGDIVATITFWNTKMQIKFKGTMKGVSGDQYTIREVYNYMNKPWVEGQANNVTQAATALIFREGAIIGTLHFTWHVTTNANGELTTDMDNEIVNCH